MKLLSTAKPPQNHRKTTAKSDFEEITVEFLTGFGMIISATGKLTLFLSVQLFQLFVVAFAWSVGEIVSSVKKAIEPAVEISEVEPVKTETIIIIHKTIDNA